MTDSRGFESQVNEILQGGPELSVERGRDFENVFDPIGSFEKSLSQSRTGSVGKAVDGMVVKSPLQQINMCRCVEKCSNKYVFFKHYSVQVFQKLITDTVRYSLVSSLVGWIKRWEMALDEIQT